MELPLRDHFLADAIPHPDFPGRIARGYIVPRGREAGYVYDGGVAGVLCADGGVIDGAEEDGFAGLDVLA